MNRICRFLWFLIFLVSITLALPVWANQDCLGPLLSKVTLQLHSEQWVTTQTALVNVNVSAAVNDQGIEAVQGAVLQKLSKLSDKGEWHILSFDRSLDKSGLESIQIVAQARLPQNALGNLRDQAKSISKPGETFTIDSVQFIPSEDELKQANVDLRNALYEQAKAEIDTLNKIYPAQKYYLYSIDFFTSPRPMMFARTADAQENAAPAPLNVGNKTTVQATVVAASLPDQVIQSIHNIK